MNAFGGKADIKFDSRERMVGAEGGEYGWLFAAHNHEGLLSLICLRREFL